MTYPWVSMRKATSVLLLLVACEEPEGRSDTLRYVVPPGLEAPSQESLDQVAELFGLEVVEEDGPAGAVSIFLAEEVEGRSLNFASGLSCTPYVYVESPNPAVLAHEIGHAYGLHHVDDPENLMAEAPGGLDLTDRQIDTVRKNAWILENDCF